jgi:putative colanic acid biosynthesis acetyltransferase WcaF
MQKIILKEYNQDWFDRGRNGAIILLWWFVQGTIFRFSLHNSYGFRRLLLKLFGARIGEGVRIRSSAKFTYPWKVEIGEYSWVGDAAEFYSLDHIKVGSNCVISQKAYLCTGSHDITDPCFGLILKPIVINDNAWIGADAFVGQGVTIGAGAVLAARSSAFKDLPEWKVCIGNPAKAVKDRKLKEI